MALATPDCSTTHAPSSESAQGAVLAAKAVEPHSKGSVLDTKAVEPHGKGSVSPQVPPGYSRATFAGAAAASAALAATLCLVRVSSV